jgi:hypothetical protein
LSVRAISPDHQPVHSFLAAHKARPLDLSGALLPIQTALRHVGAFTAVIEQLKTGPPDVDTGSKTRLHHITTAWVDGQIQHRSSPESARRSAGTNGLGFNRRAALEYDAAAAVELVTVESAGRAPKRWWAWQFLSAGQFIVISSGEPHPYGTRLPGRRWDRALNIMIIRP